jgi:hypothetical protein
MNEKHYAQMFAALKRITQYQQPERLKKRAWNDWGLGNSSEAVEMAYENVLQEAKSGLKGVRKPKPAPTATLVPSQVRGGIHE